MCALRREDAPADCKLVVTSAKGDDKTICLKCYYVKRGSFGKLKLLEFLSVLNLVPTLADKQLGNERVDRYGFAACLLLSPHSQVACVLYAVAVTCCVPRAGSPVMITDG